MTINKTATLAQRLRALADELESAERYGIPLPRFVSVSAGEYLGASFTLDAADFKAWAEYVEAPVVEACHHGRHWRSVHGADVNGLAFDFSTSTPTDARAAQDSAWATYAENVGVAS